MSYDIKDISLWESGETKIQWVKSNMDLEGRFIETVRKYDVVIGDAEAVKEAADALVGLLRIIHLQHQVVPQLAGIAGDLQGDLIAIVAGLECLKGDILDPDAVLPCRNRRKILLFVIVGVKNPCHNSSPP